MSCSILVNRVPWKPFKAQKGLKPGDPMSPYLFAIIMENLSRKLCALKRTKGFKFHPKCNRTYTIALLFTDDLLIFNYADTKSIRLIQQYLEEFSATSSLFTNWIIFLIYFRCYR